MCIDAVTAVVDEAALEEEFAFAYNVARNRSSLPFTLSSIVVRSGTFSGGDYGEGLDLLGDFVYAVNVNGPLPLSGPGAPVEQEMRLGDAVFVSDRVPNRTFEVSAQHAIESVEWKPSFAGNTSNDETLSKLMESLRWSDTDPCASVTCVAPPVDSCQLGGGQC